MSVFMEAIAKVKTSVWQFIRWVNNTNRDLPFHDYQLYSYVQDEGEQT